MSHIRAIGLEHWARPFRISICCCSRHISAWSPARRWQPLPELMLSVISAPPRYCAWRSGRTACADVRLSFFAQRLRRSPYRQYRRDCECNVAACELLRGLDVIGFLIAVRAIRCLIPLLGVISENSSMRTEALQSRETSNTFCLMNFFHSPILKTYHRNQRDASCSPKILWMF